MSNAATGASSLAYRWLWRREALRVAFAGMEVSWFTPFFMVFVEAARAWPPLVLAGIFLLVELSFYFWSVFVGRRQLSGSVEMVAVLLALPVLILLGWRVFLFGDMPLGDLTWIPASFSGLITSNGAGFWAIMASVLFLWWRGISLSRREFEFDSVAFAFRSGLLFLVVGTLLISMMEGRQVIAFIFPFFISSLVAISLARLEELGQIKGEKGKLFDATWLGILGGSIALVMGVGTIFLLVARPASIDLMRSIWAPIGNFLLEAIAFIITIVLIPFEPLMAWLSGLFAQGWQAIADTGAMNALLGIGPTDVPEQSLETTSRVLEYVLTGLRMACGLGILVALLAGGIWLLRRERARILADAVEQEDLDAGLGDALAGLLRGMRNRLRGAANLVGQFGMGTELLTAISVRNIYANASRLARKRGYPRHKASTAYEYLPEMQRAFPDARNEAQQITDAYVGVAYGDLPTGKDDLAQLRAAYERLKNSPVPAKT